MDSKYFLYTHTNELTKGLTSVVRQDPDGTMWFLGEPTTDSAYLAWLEEGNKPEEWNPDEETTVKE